MRVIIAQEGIIVHNPVSKSMRAVWGCAEAQINKQTAEGQPLGSAARSLLPTGNSEKEVSMRITLELPDNTVSIKYCVDDGGTYPSDDKPVTLGMIIAVNENHPARTQPVLTATDPDTTNVIRPDKIKLPEAPHCSEPHI